MKQKEKVERDVGGEAKKGDRKRWINEKRKDRIGNGKKTKKEDGICFCFDLELLLPPGREKKRKKRRKEW